MAVCGSDTWLLVGAGSPFLFRSCEKAKTHGVRGLSRVAWLQKWNFAWQWLHHQLGPESGKPGFAIANRWSTFLQGHMRAARK
jgi:hypothetical protein